MDFDFRDEGTGPTLLFLPGSYSNHAAWRGVQKTLKGSYRIITTSLPGYGGSMEVRDEYVSDMSLMSEFVAQLVDFIGEPVHLIGHSYGGLVAYAATLSGKASPLSLITFEGNPIYSRHESGEFPWMNSTTEMLQSFEDAYASGDPNAAEIIIDFWSKPGVFQSMPQQFMDYCRSTVSTNILDWRSARGFNPYLREYADIGVSCSVVRGELANQAIVDISEEISREIYTSSLHVVEGADHFLISTHPQECAKIIDDHMSEYVAKQSAQ